MWPLVHLEQCTTLKEKARAHYRSLLCILVNQQPRTLKALFEEQGLMVVV